MREVFFRGNFFSLWLGQVAAQFGERLSQMALLGIIYELDHISTAATSWLLFFMILPVFLLSPFAGVCVDRLDRKKTMIYTDLARAALLLILTLVVHHSTFHKAFDLWPVYLIVFLMFSTSRFFMPAKSAIIPEIVHEDELRTANSISSTSKMIATVLGLWGGGLIVPLWGLDVCFIINSFCFILSAVSLLFVKRAHRLVNSSSSGEPVLKRVSNVYQHFKDGLREVLYNKSIRYLLKSISVIMAVGGGLFVLFPVFVYQEFGLKTNGVSLLLGFLGVGLFLGAIFVGRSHRLFEEHQRLFSWSLLVAGIFFIIFLMAKSFSMACALMLIVGAVSAPIVICTETMLQSMVEQDKIGRVYSAIEVVIHGVFLLSMLLFGGLGSMTSAKLMLGILMSASLFIYFLFIKLDKAQG